jgi:hypothetical protein
MKQLEPVTTEEEERWREEFSHAIRSGAYGGDSLHLPDESGEAPICVCASREEWVTKQWALFPVGHEQICKQCAFRQRRRE